MSTASSTAKGRREMIDSLLFGVLISSYAAARILQVYPRSLPMIAVVALHVLPPAVFAFVHGARSYGVRGIAAFIGITLLVGNVAENIGVTLGIPFGRYYFTDLMGPKLFAVPVLLGFAYIGMAYCSWTLARILLGWSEARGVARNPFAVPVLAAFAMVAWDLSQEPVWATILRAWVWRDGGVYFGVPLMNFFGWFLTVYIIFQLFAIYCRTRSATHRVPNTRYWRQALAFYGISAAGNLLLLLPNGRPAIVVDLSGVAWRTRDITAACALVTVCAMCPFVLFAWLRLQRELPFRRWCR